MAVVEKTIDIIGDELFCDIILSKTIPVEAPVDLYDEAVTILRNYACYSIDKLQSVNYPNVTRCGSDVFSNCKALKSVNLEKCTSIDARIFKDCTSLETVSVPLITSFASYIFAGCSSLESIDFPNITFVGDGAFDNCINLSNVKLPKASYLRSIAFRSCVKLKQIDLPSINTIVGNPFTSCSGLEKINIGPSISSLSSKAFSGVPEGCVINLPFEEGVITGAPWGATGAIINYGVEYCGDVPIPTT